VSLLCSLLCLFRFPLVVAPRYIPGLPLGGLDVGSGTTGDTDAVPDASRITPPVLLPGFPNPVRLRLSVMLDPAGLPVRDARSSLHAVVEDVGDHGVRTLRIHSGERLDRDFVLRFRCAENAVCTSLAVAPDATPGESTLMLTVVPPESASPPAPRDAVFVLDRSGSMGDWKIVAARRAIARMVDTLTDRDRCLVIAFDDVIETPSDLPAGLSAATNRNRFRAIEFLAKLEARGGTEMTQPLTRAVDLLANGDPGRDRILVLVTDGQVGNEDQILQTIAPRLAGVRVFTLGIDRAVNAGFLERLASFGGGRSELVESEERLDEVMDRVHRAIATPVLTELAFCAEGFEMRSATLVPKRSPALFAGVPLVVFGRCAGSGEGSLGIEAHTADGVEYRARVPAHRTSVGALSSLWARGHLRELEDCYAAGAAGPELAETITSTSLRYGVLCRFTAFVAVDPERANESGDVHCINQPVEYPSGWEPSIACYPPPAPCEYEPMSLCEDVYPAAMPEQAMPEQAMPGVLRDSRLSGTGPSRNRKSRADRKSGRDAGADFANRVRVLLERLKAITASGLSAFHRDHGNELTRLRRLFESRSAQIAEDVGLGRAVDDLERLVVLGEGDAEAVRIRLVVTLESVVAAIRTRPFWR